MSGAFHANRLRTTRQTQQTSTLRRFQFIPSILWYFSAKKAPPPAMYRQKLVFPMSKIQNSLLPKQLFQLGLKQLFSSLYSLSLTKSSPKSCNKCNSWWRTTHPNSVTTTPSSEELKLQDLRERNFYDRGSRIFQIHFISFFLRFKNTLPLSVHCTDL